MTRDATRDQGADPLDAHLADLTGAAPVDADEVALADALTLAVTGGKRLRPALLLAAFDALAPGGTSPEHREVAERCAAAVEMLHAALVAHDDVIDGDTLRRGRPNAVAAFSARARATGASERAAAGYGSAAGILVGDLALASAIRGVATCGATPARTGALLDLVDAALRATAAGELADVRLSHAPGDLEAALDVARRKTGVYSFALPLQLATVLADRGELTGALERYGLDVGTAFQLRDDLIGMFGDPADTGKSALSDLREGKFTALVAYARHTPAWPMLASVLGLSTVTEPEAESVRHALVGCGARQAVEDLAAEYESRAVSMLPPAAAVVDAVIRDAVTPPTERAA